MNESGYRGRGDRQWIGKGSIHKNLGLAHPTHCICRFCLKAITPLKITAFNQLYVHFTL